MQNSGKWFYTIPSVTTAASGYKAKSVSNYGLYSPFGAM